MENENESNFHGNFDAYSTFDELMFKIVFFFLKSMGEILFFLFGRPPPQYHFTKSEQNLS